MGSVQVVLSEQRGAEGGDGVTEGSNFKQPGCERLSLLTCLNLVPKDNATHLFLLFECHVLFCSVRRPKSQFVWVFFAEGPLLTDL